MNVQTESGSLEVETPETAPLASEREARPDHVTRNVSLGLAAVVALSVSYYFAIALPSIDRAKLGFEQMKYEEGKNEEWVKKQIEELQQEKNRTLLSGCLQTAENDYWEFVKLNGTAKPNQPDVYTAPVHIWERADRNKKAALEECHRQYGR